MNPGPRLYETLRPPLQDSGARCPPITLKMKNDYLVKVTHLLKLVIIMLRRHINERIIISKHITLYKHFIDIITTLT